MVVRNVVVVVLGNVLWWGGMWWCGGGVVEKMLHRWINLVGMSDFFVIFTMSLWL